MKVIVPALLKNDGKKSKIQRPTPPINQLTIIFCTAKYNYNTQWQDQIKEAEEEEVAVEITDVLPVAEEEAAAVVEEDVVTAAAAVETAPSNDPIKDRRVVPEDVIPVAARAVEAEDEDQEEEEGGDVVAIMKNKNPPLPKS